MSDLPMQFPILALSLEKNGVQEGIECFLEEDWFAEMNRSDLAEKRLVGALVVDAAGRCWRILDMIDMGPAGRSWRKVLNTVFRLFRRVRYELAEEALPFEAVRERVRTSIQENPWYWRDDEAVAGEDGPPRDEQEMLDELVEKVRGTANMRELIHVLDSWGS